MTASPSLILRLSGDFSLERNGVACRLVYAKSRALLAYLAMQPGQARTRIELAALFWPQLAHEVGLANLRLVLHELRQVFNPADARRPIFVVDRETVRLLPGDDLAVDVAAFTVPSSPCPDNRGQQTCAPCLLRMEDAAALHRGEFLAGFSLPECNDFEDWLVVQRETLQLRTLSLLARLADCHAEAGDFGAALPFAMRAQDLEPWDEGALQRVMRLFAQSGQATAALARYDAYRQSLWREMGVEPAESVQVLADQIRRGSFQSRRRRRGDGAVAGRAERRQVTVLFCEFQVLAADDPDEALSLLSRPLLLAREAVGRTSGYLAPSRGGTRLAYFGYPQARENAALLAVRAALAIARNRFPGVSVRLGVHTGVVIGGDPQAPDAVGEISGAAMHLAQLAAAGEILLGSTTRHLLGGHVECSPVLNLPLAGGAASLVCFRCRAESRELSRFVARTGSLPQAPLIARRRELAGLLRAWRAAIRGGAGILLLRGEAGIGKSRLLAELTVRLAPHRAARLELFCRAEHRTSDFRPVLDHLASAAGLSAAPAPTERLARLAAYLRGLSVKGGDVLPALLAEQLPWPVDDLPGASAAAAPAASDDLLSAMLEYFWLRAEGRPLLLSVEDLQWADTATLSLLERLLASPPVLPFLLVCTARPEFDAAWPPRGATQVALEALSEVEMERLLRSIAPDLGRDEMMQIVARADGIPLYAEELARETHGDPASVIPASLRDLLTARLDGVDGAARVAQAAAACGGSCDFGTLLETCLFDATFLRQAIARLLAAGILVGEVDGQLRFRQALLRAAAYQSQTRGEREAVHRRIAGSLKERVGQARPDLVAPHLAAGGEIAGAIRCWLAAGQNAARRGSVRESLIHYRAGSALLDKLPNASEHEQLRLELLLALGAAAFAAQGYASAEGRQVFEQAMSLCGGEGKTADSFPALWGLWASASSRVGYPAARVLAEQLVHRAALGDDPVFLQQAHFALGNTAFWQGDFAVARRHLEASLALDDPASHQRQLAEFGEDAGITGLAYLSWVAWFVGDREAAHQASLASVARARRAGHPFSLAYALTFAAILHCRFERPEEALAVAGETAALAAQHDFPLWSVGADVARGWALSMGGQAAGLQLLGVSIDALRQAMPGVSLAVLEPLIDANLRQGLHGVALRLCDQALGIAGRIGDGHVSAELQRLRALALLGQEEVDDGAVRRCFGQALRIARRQRAFGLLARIRQSVAAHGRGKCLAGGGARRKRADS